MAKIYITEHKNPTYLLGAPLPVLAYPPIASQTVVNTGATTQSAAFNAETKIICIHTDSICSVEFGANPTATTASRATPTTLPVGKTAAANGLILYSGTGLGKYGPFMPLQDGDAGIRSIQTIQNSTSYVSGEYAVGLCKPLLTLPITTLGVASERDLVNQLPSMPKIEDGANLVWLMYSGAATPVNSSIYGHLDIGWA